jgi:hypothetical protein
MSWAWGIYQIKTSMTVQIFDNTYSRIFPVKINSIKLMLLDEIHHVISQSPMNVSTIKPYTPESPS